MPDCSAFPLPGLSLIEPMLVDADGNGDMEGMYASIRFKTIMVLKVLRRDEIAEALKNNK